ncbi:hypothetical protein [Corynebacterium diphtheriae]|nr:hypothetical protein [Corynebacterium diphtheriae]
MLIEKLHMASGKLLFASCSGINAAGSTESSKGQAQNYGPQSLAS